MLAYKLNTKGEAEPVADLEEWAGWYNDHQSELIILRDDAINHRGEHFVIMTRFRGQVGPFDDPAHPLVWVTEGTDGDFFGATSTKAQAIQMHKSTVAVVRSRYQSKRKDRTLKLNLFKR
jgi:hypothetical protein